MKDVDWPELIGRTMVRDEVSKHFVGPGNEMYSFDFRSDLKKIIAPTLVLAGEEDPITPPAFSVEIAQHLPSGYAQLVCMSGAGHGVVPDKPEEVLALIRVFIADCRSEGG